MKLLTIEVVQASFTGFIKTVLLLIGAFVLLRFLGQLAIAKRNMEQERESLKKEKDFLKEKNEKLKNFGKVKVNKEKPKGDVVDVDFEEVK